MLRKRIRVGDWVAYNVSYDARVGKAVGVSKTKVSVVDNGKNKDDFHVLDRSQCVRMDGDLWAKLMLEKEKRYGRKKKNKD